MWTFLVSRVLQAFLALMALSIMVFYFTWATGDPVYYLLPVGLEESTPELRNYLKILTHKCIDPWAWRSQETLLLSLLQTGQGPQA